MREKFLITFLLIFLFSLSIYFYFGKPKVSEKKKESLIYDETFIKSKIDKFLEDNPNANESYARDVVYHDIAIAEKNSSTCEEIKTEWLKQDCYNYFKVAR
jgi:hypothetical protein